MVTTPRATRDIVVIAASAGGVETLSRLVHDLPADIPAAVFVMIHLPADAPSLLPNILRRGAKVNVRLAENAFAFQHGSVYVNPPDRHMLLRDGKVYLTRGPRENGHRPSADALFRSAAVCCDGRAIGVVLSGTLDDGTAGLLAIKQRGGLAVVQDPEEALFPGMPTSAIQSVAIDHVLRIAEIGPLLDKACRAELHSSHTRLPERMKQEADMAFVESVALNPQNHPGPPSPFTCPDCDGTLFEIQDGGPARYRCRVGHAFSMQSLMSGHSEKLEAALWSAVVALKEKVNLSRRMEQFLRQRNLSAAAARFNTQAIEAEQRAELIQNLLLHTDENAPDEATTASDAARSATNPSTNGGEKA